jgi:hypothetical protein
VLKKSPELTVRTFASSWFELSNRLLFLPARNELGTSRNLMHVLGALLPRLPSIKSVMRQLQQRKIIAGIAVGTDFFKCLQR